MTEKETIKDGLVEEFYDNGQVSVRRNFKNGVIHGTWESYYENGQLEQRRSFK